MTYITQINHIMTKIVKLMYWTHVCI